MKEIFRACTKISNHRFSTNNGEGYFMDESSCPFCGAPLETVEIETKPLRASAGGGSRLVEADGFFRGEYIDKRPKLPWFYKIKDINKEDQPRSGENWGISESKKLGKFYEKYGEADAKTWKNIAEKEFKRSLAAVERQLRATIACLNGDKTWEELFPDI